jgi:hypothetical protein
LSEGDEYARYFSAQPARCNWFHRFQTRTVLPSHLKRYLLRRNTEMDKTARFQGGSVMVRETFIAKILPADIEGSRGISCWRVGRCLRDGAGDVWLLHGVGMVSSFHRLTDNESAL